MIKHFVVMLILTIVGVLFIKQLGAMLHSVGHLQLLSTLYIAKLLPFTHHKLFVSRVITVFLLPIIFALIPSFLYWLISKRNVPALSRIYWIFWIAFFAIFALIGTK